MGKRIAILQPGYLPWLGYFDQIARADLVVHRDDLQYLPRAWRNRSQLKGANGPLWLTVPVNLCEQSAPRVCDAPLANEDWPRRHLTSLRHCYSRCEYFVDLFPRLTEYLSRPWTNLADLCIAGVELLAEILGIDTPAVRASTIDGIAHRQESERMIALCEHFGATEYISAAGESGGLDVVGLNNAGIDVLYQDYQHPTYEQGWGAFTPHLSAVDLLMNVGPRARDVLLSSPAPHPAEVSCA